MARTNLVCNLEPGKGKAVVVQVWEPLAVPAPVLIQCTLVHLQCRCIQLTHCKGNPPNDCATQHGRSGHRQAWVS